MAKKGGQGITLVALQLALRSLSIPHPLYRPLSRSAAAHYTNRHKRNQPQRSADNFAVVCLLIDSSGYRDGTCQSDKR